MSLEEITAHKEFIGKCRDGFNEFILPGVEANPYNLDLISLGNLTSGLLFYADSTSRDDKPLGLYRSGLNCIFRARSIEEELRSKHIPSKELVLKFGAYLAQLSLSLEVAENNFKN